jgi:hypothetical protein
MRQVPPYHPRRVPLGERVRISVSLLEADQATASFLAGELARLRASALGHWLRPARADLAQISLSAVIRERAVAFFPLDQPRHGRPAQMIANLVALDTAALFAESRRRGVDGDGLAWFSGADAIAAAALAPLIAVGAQAGLATVLSTVSPQAAGQLAALANVLVIRGPAGASPAGADLAGADPAATVLAGTTLAGAVLAGDQFALVIRSPEQQVPQGRFVAGRMR